MKKTVFASTDSEKLALIDVIFADVRKIRLEIEVLKGDIQEKEKVGVSSPEEQYKYLVDLELKLRQCAYWAVVDVESLLLNGDAYVDLDSAGSK